MLPDCLEFQSPNVQTHVYVFHDTNGKNLGRPLKIEWFLLNENCTDTHSLVSHGKDNEEIVLELGREKVPTWECLFVHRKQGLFLSVYVGDIKMAGKRPSMAPMWKKVMKDVDLDEPTSFLDRVYLGCTHRECKPNNIIFEQHKEMFESRIFCCSN